MPQAPMTGRCFCRAITFEYRGDPNWMLHCHCESCRRATSAPIVTWISVLRSGFRITKGSPRSYQSSTGVRRSFCGDCGSPLTYVAETIPEEVHILAGTLDDPSPVRPDRHVFVEDQLPWFEVFDELPRYTTTSRGTKPVRVGPRQR